MEIDYTQFNPNHPLGSAYYDIAIRNTPVMEPITDESQLMKYKLVTLNDGVTAVPTISVAQNVIIVDRDYTGEILINPSTNPTYNVVLGYTAILANKNVGTLVVTETNAKHRRGDPVQRLCLPLQHIRQTIDHRFQKRH